MASPPTLDIAALLEPIPGDNPAGEKYVPQDIQDKLDEDRKEVEPEEGSSEEAKKADWKGIIRTASNTLSSTSKSLLIAARLTEALVKAHGFAGLRDGFRLLREMFEQCWDRLYPALSEPAEDESEEEAEERKRDDLEKRAAPFHWLDEADRGARFPNTIRAVPIFVGKEAVISWQVWNESVHGKGVPQDVVEQAVQATKAEKCRTDLEDLTEARDELIRLSQVLNEKLGHEAAPGFSGLRQAVAECHKLLSEVVERKGGGVVEEPTADASEGAPGTTAAAEAGGTLRAARTRDEAYRQLAEAASLLQRLEPHSPIPYLILRAVELGALPFPQLMSQLIRNTDVLSELKRELGIKEEG
jgi:type VI secretion system protein ImpA